MKPTSGVLALFAVFVLGLIAGGIIAGQIKQTAKPPTTGRYQFSSSENIFFVMDTQNGDLKLFSPSGSKSGTWGNGYREFQAPPPATP